MPLIMSAPVRTAITLKSFPLKFFNFKIEIQIRMIDYNLVLPVIKQMLARVD
jgi:hypothetical protein